MRRTKIIATMGPATDKPGMLESMVESGVDLFRINYSHQTHLEHRERAQALKEISAGHGLEVGLIADLQGPKIRLKRFKDGAILLHDGDEFTLDPSLPDTAGSEKQVSVTYRALAQDVNPGDILLIDDGRIVLEVVNLVKTQVRCRVIVGGKLSDNKGINLKGGGLSAGALTRKDRKDLQHGIEIGVDYFAISFVCSAADIEQARALLNEAGSNAGIIAKFERVEALDNAAEIIEAADAIMIARGDLGVEIGDAALPPVQKKLIKQAQDMDRPVITATQMMETMIYSPIPTRAEVFDVANAILDGTDAVMLSGETSIGMFPDRVVESMARICEGNGKTEGNTGIPPPHQPGIQAHRRSHCHVRHVCREPYQGKRHSSPDGNRFDLPVDVAHQFRDSHPGIHPSRINHAQGEAVPGRLSHTIRHHAYGPAGSQRGNHRHPAPAQPGQRR